MQVDADGAVDGDHFGLAGDVEDAVGVVAGSALDRAVELAGDIRQVHELVLGPAPVDGIPRGGTVEDDAMGDAPAGRPGKQGLDLAQQQHARQFHTGDLLV